ncbi:MAG: TRAP transporter fused permease subunit [Hyphomicrobiaceae bacterium]|nr:TRAP transporter fused permease subunit [Hyphomicrobiaceae bacterium]
MEASSGEQAGNVDREPGSERLPRNVGRSAQWFVYVFLILFGIYHYVTAGTGIPVDYWHMGIHLSGVLVVIFILYPASSRAASADARNRWLAPAGVPAIDWLLGAVGAAAALWIGFSWEGFDFSLFGHSVRLQEQALRQGDPAGIDIVFGSLLMFIVLEATRRVIGWVLPIIVMVFTGFALFGPYMPFDLLKHPGVEWSQFVNNVYFPSEGIFGIPLWVASTIVFHFVLFGSVAQKMGLGKLFVDVSTVVAGRYIGGPAKVSVVSSALFGTISGSSVANVVSTGSLTIPNMKRLGYRAHFAGAVEAAASAGGQITPPIMGAAAFIMAEFLQIPYSKIVIAAAAPAFMHYLGVFTMVHFEAKRLGLQGEAPENIPRAADVIKRGWPAALPLVVLLYVLFSGFTPYMAAFWGITVCIAVGLVNPMHRMSLKDLADAFYEGGRSALAVGAICAAVGVVVAVITLTGLAFRMGFMVTNAAQSVGGMLHLALTFGPVELLTLQDLTLFLSMLFIGIACTLMGAGIPTTALYIMLATVAQPAFTNLGVPPLATHLFVFYYGIIAEVTPPVCTSAYAAAAIANANPWRTGLTAFRLSCGKILVPFVFCYSPALLLVLPGYTWLEFFQTGLTCAAGVALLGIAFTGFLNTPLRMPVRLLLGAAGLASVHPGIWTDLLALVIAAPILAQQYLFKRQPVAATRV